MTRIENQSWNLKERICCQVAKKGARWDNITVDVSEHHYSEYCVILRTEYRRHWIPTWDQQSSALLPTRCPRCESSTLSLSLPALYWILSLPLTGRLCLFQWNNSFRLKKFIHLLWLKRLGCNFTTSLLFSLSKALLLLPFPSVQENRVE